MIEEFSSIYSNYIVDINSGHTTVYRYRYQEGGDYIKEEKEYTDFNTNIVLGYVGVNDVDVNNGAFVESIINNEENKRLLFDKLKLAIEYQSGLTFTEDESKQYFEITNKIAVDGRFMCPVPVSRKYLDILINYIHEFLGIKVEQSENGNHEFVSTEGSASRFTSKSGNPSYYHYLNCIYNNPKKLHKPVNQKDHDDPTTYLFKDWNCDAGCFSMIVEPEKMDNFVISLEEDSKRKYAEKEIEKCYDISLKSNDKEDNSRYGTIFKAKPDVIMKLSVNSKLNVIANGFSDDSGVTMVSILITEQAFDIETARIHLNRLTICKYIFDTSNAFDYHKAIQPIVNDPIQLFIRMIDSIFGLYAYTKPFLQYHGAITLANLANSNVETDDEIDLENADTIENMLNDDEQNTTISIADWRNKYAEDISKFEVRCDKLANKFRDVQRLDEYGTKDSNSINSLCLHMLDVCRAVRDLIECIKPNISKQDKVSIELACRIEEVGYKTSSFYNRSGREKYPRDSYNLNPDVIMGTIISNPSGDFMWGDKRLHGDIQATVYTEIVNKNNTIVEDIPKYINDMLLSNVESAVKKYFKGDGEIEEESDEEVEEEITSEYEIPNCDWLLKLYQLVTLKWANSEVGKYIITSVKNMLIRIRRMLNK